MIAALRSEWIKLTTTTSSWVLAAVAFGLPLLVVAVSGSAATRTDGEDLALLIMGVGGLSLMLLGALTVTSLTAEFSSNTIRPTFAALPDRWRPLLAKLGLHVGVTFVLMSLVSGLSWFAGSGLAEGDQSLDVPGVRPSLIGLVVLAVLVTGLGYALGLLLRSTALAVIVLLIWPFLGESVIGGVLTRLGWDSAFDWMPYQAGYNLITVNPSGEDLGRVGGGLWFALWVAVLLAFGLWRTHRRDA